MRKKTLLISVFAAFAYLALSGYASGPANNLQGDVTGSPASMVTCAQGGCHGGGTGLQPTGQIDLRKKSTGMNGPLVTSYSAGESYYVTVVGAGSTNHFGFQLVALKDSDKSRVGTYGGFPGNAQGYPQVSPTIAEHKGAIAKNGLGQYFVVFEWTAPTSAAGPVTMYAIINAVNKDGLVGGDYPSKTFSLKLADKTSVANIKNEVVFKVYPNPAKDNFTLDMEKADAGMYQMSIYSAAGTLVHQNEFNVSAIHFKENINTADWATGLYFVRVGNEDDVRVLTVVKQ